MRAASKDIYIEQGATFFLKFQWVTATRDAQNKLVPGPPHDLTNYTARMQIRVKRGAPVLAEATTENGRITLGEGGDPTTGHVTVTLSATETDALTVTKAKYDLEVRSSLGVVTRLLQGEVEISPNITQDVVP